MFSFLQPLERRKGMSQVRGQRPEGERLDLTPLLVTSIKENTNF
jgi:hypothetical protein